MPEPVYPSPAVDEAEPGGRRDRALDAGEDVLLAGAAEKVLHGWLQNRHQTLYPLTVNVGTLDDARRQVLAQMMTIAARAGMVPPEERMDGMRAWLGSVGADPAMLAALDAAVPHPPATSAVIEAILEHRLAAYAYILALKAVDARDASATHFLDYLAARLNLPTTVVRSATRRYRQ